jgi:hypothetical protein
MQIDHFVRCIIDRNTASISSFDTALQTDTVLSNMVGDAAASGRVGDELKTTIATTQASQPAVTRLLKRLKVGGKSN